MAAEYRYQPLPPAAEYGRTPPFTRIIRLAFAQSRDDPLVAALELVDVSTTTPYEALSYTWGTDPPSDYLWLGNTPLPIKPNLEAALRSLRLPTMFRRLWVDAVCIDQSNVDEKSRQIQYMRLVYKHSARVIIWLGLKTPGVEQAFEVASRLSHVVESLEDAATATTGNELDPETVEAFVESVTSDLPGTALQHLHDLFERPYWTRTWCIQEVVAASWAIVRVEELEISFSELLSTTLIVTEWRAKVAIDKPFVMWHRIYLQRRPRQPLPPSEVPGSIGDLLDVLHTARGFQATDIRDKIFAVMGICDEGLYPALALTQVEGASNSGRRMQTLRTAITSWNGFMQRHGPDPNWGTPRALRPDYQKDAVTAYTDMTRFLLRKPPRLLNVLHHVQHNMDPTVSPDEYPSWVPKWFEPATCFPFQGAFLAGQCDGHFRYFAEIHDNPLRGEPLRPRVLSLDGFRCDVVDRISDVMHFGFSDDKRTISAIQTAWSQLFPFPMCGPNTPAYMHRPAEPLGVAFCNALAASPLGFITASMIRNSRWGNWLNAVPANATQEWRGEGPITDECQREIAAFLAHLSPVGGGEVPLPVPETCVAFMGAVRMYSLNRRVFLTRGGRIGIGPSVMQPGDEVTVLLGGKVPFVLRPREDHHVFMGSCYMRDNNVMWGVETEKVIFRKPGALARVAFELR
ncbi:heterokaryon incompatibility protein-domain-containing protein [Schizothecium vesticola]|uniref:Heterokaryon incompatibility protein-domain-containing protein n=1 Tax=Schizothecium vesticola TaxID=314040 RepID=A0AA40KC47_9PEZI|nr:heterokaryon incompatibility protein-domain-containing protein [Schizothecium vesticola]